MAWCWRRGRLCLDINPNLVKAAKMNMVMNNDAGTATRSCDPA